MQVLYPVLSFALENSCTWKNSCMHKSECLKLESVAENLALYVSSEIVIVNLNSTILRCVCGIEFHACKESRMSTKIFCVALR